LLSARIFTGAVLGVLVVVLSMFGPTPVLAAAIGILWLVGAAEWGRLAGLDAPGRGVFVGVVLGLMLYFGWRGFGSVAATTGIWFALVAVLLAIAAMARFPRVFPAPVVIAGGLVSLLPSWLAVTHLHFIEPALALVAIVIIWGADVGAYAGGRTFGRHKLAPRISPGKTWEGVVGGLTVAMLIAAVAAVWLDLPLRFIAVAAVAAAVSVLGDLNVSMLKRDAGLKDSGRLLPGHGGALDRIDGLTTGLPIIAIGLKLAGFLD
jgi:phosphatidate cytidylyltransferase